jgi:hypothetical protein
VLSSINCKCSIISPFTFFVDVAVKALSTFYLKCTIKVHIKTPKIELSTEKEVAQLILNKDEKCIRQEILKFLRRRNRCWSKAI